MDTESYADRAERALIAGDLDTAAELYEDWLKAAPGDHLSWYNYACVLALQDNLSRAVGALQNAVATGWNDSTWAANDPDLEALHGNSVFKGLLMRMGSQRQREEDTLSGDARYIVQTRLAPYQIHLPFSYSNQPERRYPLVVLLHDRGDDMTSMNELRERLALPGVIYAQPRAPHPVTESGFGFEYWPRSLSSNGDENLAALAREQAGEWIHDVIDDIITRHRVDTTQVFVVGFSHGGAAAYMTAMKRPHAIRGVASLGGFLPQSHADSTAIDTLRGMPITVFIGHGRRDRVIQTSEADRAHELFQQSGIASELHVYPSEHEVPDEMVVDLADWILATCASPYIAPTPAPVDSVDVLDTLDSPVDMAE